MPFWDWCCCCFCQTFDASCVFCKFAFFFISSSLFHFHSDAHYEYWSIIVKALVFFSLSNPDPLRVSDKSFFFLFFLFLFFLFFLFFLHQTGWFLLSPCLLSRTYAPAISSERLIPGMRSPVPLLYFRLLLLFFFSFFFPQLSTLTPCRTPGAWDQILSSRASDLFACLTCFGLVEQKTKTKKKKKKKKKKRTSFPFSFGNQIIIFIGDFNI